MNKRVKGRKFSRKAGPRKAFIKSLSENLLIKGKIKTTEARAKEIRPVVEKLITKARKGDLHSTRQVAEFLTKTTTKKLVSEIAPKYKGVNGGYTRITKLMPRKSDGAKMAYIELITK